eukprot:scaffold213777_cov35-Attheya_sp.AAC.1
MQLSGSSCSCSGTIGTLIISVSITIVLVHAAVRSETESVWSKVAFQAALERVVGRRPVCLDSRG